MDASLYALRIYTKTGITREAIWSGRERVLHIGSGARKLPGATTVDVLELPGVDVVHDLDSMPWPFEAGSFDLVYAHNVLEHLDDQVSVMEEIHRLLKPGGRVVITVPYFRSVDAWSDLTHRHFYTAASMDTFLKGKAEYQYTKHLFLKKSFWHGWPQPSRNPLARLFKRFIAAHPAFYDQYLSLLFPVEILVWELETIK